MRPSVLTLRALAAEFAGRILFPIVLTVIIAAAILITIVIWLTTMSAWWWVLAVIIFIAVLLAATVLIIARLIIVSIKPAQTKRQSILVKDFVDILENLSEITQTPKVILVFRVLRDAVQSKDGGFVKKTIESAPRLKNGFLEIRRSFEDAA